VDEAVLRDYAFPPSSDSVVLVCGLPGVYDKLCGPRTEKGLAPESYLAKLGYDERRVVKF
jgi:hypothetical protein